MRGGWSRWKWKCSPDDVGGRRRRVEVCRCWRERRDHRRRLFRFVMGKADTHRDAHLRLFIPRSTYNTSITENIPERLARRRRGCGWRKRKRKGRRVGSRSPGDAIRARLEILRTVVVPPLNALPPLPPDILLPILSRNVLPRPAPLPPPPSPALPMHLHR